MKDITPILWIAGIGAVLYYAYQNNWFGNFTVTAAAAIPQTFTAAASIPNLVPISTLTPPQPQPIIATTAAPLTRIPPIFDGGPILDPGGGTLATNADGQQVLVYGRTHALPPGTV
jgi:hypothetical protein